MGLNGFEKFCARLPALTGKRILILPVYALAVLGLLILVMSFFICAFFGRLCGSHFVEEKELIRRFGASYNEYRKSVPAFFVHPKNGGKYFRFLAGREA